MTGTGPIDDAGTVKLAKKNLLVVVVTEAGVVGIIVPLNVIVTIEFGSSPSPEISTGVPTGPEALLRKIVGPTKGVTENVFEAELDPWVALNGLNSIR